MEITTLNKMSFKKIAYQKPSTCMLELWRLRAINGKEDAEQYDCVITKYVH